MPPSLRSDPQSFLDGLRSLWTPPNTASTLRIRLHGAQLFGVGVLCLTAFLVSGVWLGRLLDTPAAAYLLAPLFLAAIALCMIGGHRFVAGRTAGDDAAGFSLWRILVSLLAVFCAFVCCLALIAWMGGLAERWFPAEASVSETAPPSEAQQRLLDDAVGKVRQQWQLEEAPQRGGPDTSR